MKLSKYFSFPFHPFLFSIYPALALFAYNVRQIEPVAAYRALLVSLLAVSGIFLLLLLAFRNLQKAGLLSSLMVVLFFSYGHIYNLLQTIPFLDLIAHQSFLALAWLALLGVGVWLILRKIHQLPLLSRVLNFVGLAALVFPVYQFINYTIIMQHYHDEIAEILPIEQHLKSTSSQPLPDIYYIILDTYGRDDLLASDFGMDNSRFLAQLEQLGFTIPACTQSNYTQTELSLTSSLNLKYLDQINPNFRSGYMDRTGLSVLLKENVVRRSLEEIGYRTVAFGTGYAWSEIRDADIFYYPGSDGLDRLQNIIGLNSFESLFIKTTAARFLTTLQSSFFNDYSAYHELPESEHIALQLFLLNKLPQVPSLPGPKFIFAHILIPHGPFVFGPDGPLLPDQMVLAPDNRDLTEEEYKLGYRPEVEFINNRLIPILQEIIQRSSSPPIIIIQGDHGPFALPQILNAYYLPGNGATIYPNITPVNTFRIIFNQYFGASYPLLPDISYISTDKDPFGGEVMRNDSSSCREKVLP